MSLDFVQPAVRVSDARVTYGRGAKAFQALRGANIWVPEGVIYGLLGPSGCGKTTLLCTVLGRRRLKQGEVRVFGTQPGTRESLVPGRWVGFMPQEMSLYIELTIEETLTYFGRLHGIDSRTLKERTEFLLHFLDLPSKTRMVGNLSGGQQRRVSFAAALIHSPPLLILDEPTVGVDPLLRRSIWNYLEKLAADEGMTVIITTHYIEEARQAKFVGLMREGRLLAEGCPDRLIEKYRAPTLEECFLKLCLKDKNRGSCESCNELSYEGGEDDIQLDSKESLSRSSSTMDFSWNGKQRLNCQRMILDNEDRPCVDVLNKLHALTSKNIMRLKRNLLLIFYQFALPAIQVILLCLCVGGPPIDLNMAVVNYEGTSGIAQYYLQRLDNRTMQKRYFVDMDDALTAVKEARVWGVIEIGHNFTSSLLQRYTSGVLADNDTIDGSTIKVRLDMSNQQVGMTIQATLLQSYQDFARDIMVMFGANPLLVQLPVIFETPVYGPARPNFTEFVAPGVILAITYFMAVGLTAIAFVEERKTGLLERSFVSGVNTAQVLLSHVITQFVVLIVQVTGVLLFTFLVFKIPCHGPIIIVILLTILQGVAGMCYGLFISAMVKDEKAAIMMALGSFYPNMIVSGIIWPIQSNPFIVRVISYAFPQTMATEAMRAVLGRGWDLSHDLVWSAFVITIAWTALFLAAACAVFRHKM